MFEIGAAVFHPEKGAGIVSALGEMPGPSDGRPCYKIEMTGQIKTLLMIPVAEAESLGLRPVISTADVAEVWRVLAASPEELPEQQQQRYKLLTERVDTGRVLEIASVVRDLACRKENSRLYALARKVLDRAIRLLTSELATAQSIDLQSAESQISRVLNEERAPATPVHG